MAPVMRANYYNHSSEVEKLKKIPPLTEWDDIKVGEIYHIAPILCYDRRDFRVTSKNANMVVGILREGNETRQYSLFKQEVSTRFLAKTWTRNGQKQILF